MAYATAILIAVLILYLVTISLFRYSWDKAPAFQDIESASNVPVSIIIAFRNEAGCLSKLLSTLANQSYPSVLYEVILVDDSSEDGSQEIAKCFCATHPNFRYILNTGKTGKKQAISTGIGKARFSLVVTTDADCTPHNDWLKGIASFYGCHNPDLIIGLVDLMPGESFLSKYEQASFLGLVAAGSGAACGGHPLYCNGANLAFKRDLYDSFADPVMENVPSGDDTFLLHAAKRAGKKIMLLKSSTTVVTTIGTSSWRDFIQQRTRWTSKAGHYRDIATIYTGAVVLAMNLAIPVTAVMTFWTGKPLLFLALFCVKVIADYRLLSSYLKFLSHTLSPARFLVFSLLYPFEVMISVMGGLSFSFTWKGRKYRKR